MSYTDVIIELKNRQKKIKQDRKRAAVEAEQIQNLTKSTQVIMQVCPKCSTVVDVEVNTEPNKEKSGWIWSWLPWSPF